MGSQNDEASINFDLPDGEHSGLGANGPDLGPGAVRTESSEQLVPDVALHRHRPEVRRIL